MMTTHQRGKTKQGKIIPPVSFLIFILAVESRLHSTWQSIKAHAQKPHQPHQTQSVTNHDYVDHGLLQRAIIRRRRRRRRRQGIPSNLDCNGIESSLRRGSSKLPSSSRTEPWAVSRLSRSGRTSAFVFTQKASNSAHPSLTSKHVDAPFFTCVSSIRKLQWKASSLHVHKATSSRNNLSLLSTNKSKENFNIETNQTILRLNQRKLPKRLNQCQSDAKCALIVLGEAYPHLKFDDQVLELVTVKHILEKEEEKAWTFEQLLPFLYGDSTSASVSASVSANLGREHDTDSNNTTVGAASCKCSSFVSQMEMMHNEAKPQYQNILIIDGKSISATMQILRQTSNVPAALHLLQLSVNAVLYNRGIRARMAQEQREMQQQIQPQRPQRPQRPLRQIFLENASDDNELRKVYKAIISLLGHTASAASSSSSSPSSSPSSSSITCQLLLQILQDHMPKTSKIVPQAEIYHATMNALGKCGRCHEILNLLEAMEHSHAIRERENQPYLSDPTKMPQTVPYVLHGPCVPYVPRVPSSPTAPPVDRMAYQTAISSLAKHGQCRIAVELLQRMKSKGFPPDSNCYNALLVGIAREAGRKGKASPVEITNKKDDDEGDASVSIDNKPWHVLALELLQDMEMQSSILDDTSGGRSPCYNLSPTEQSYNSVISACGKEGAWEEAARVAKKEALLRSRRAAGDLAHESKVQEDIRSRDTNHDSTFRANQMYATEMPSQKLMEVYFKDLECYRKIGKGKDSWWEIGCYTLPVTAGDDCMIPLEYGRHCRDDESGSRSCANERIRSIIFGIQPHRNPIRNGLSVVFYDGQSRAKLGRLLLKNSSSVSPSPKATHSATDGYAHNGASNTATDARLYFSSIVGMEVNKSRRGEGLSKMFVAIWLRICLETNSYPRAAMMNKPLISLVLKQFGFVPNEGGTQVELIRLTNLDDNATLKNELQSDGFQPKFALYSPSSKCLHGLFSQRYLRSQSITILDRLSPLQSREKRTEIFIKTTFEHPVAIAENAIVYRTPSVRNSSIRDSIYLGFSKRENNGKEHFIKKSNMQSTREGTQQNCHQHPHVLLNESSGERQILDDQINAILKTNGSMDGEKLPARLEFFSTTESLHRAFYFFAKS